MAWSNGSERGHVVWNHLAGAKGDEGTMTTDEIAAARALLAAGHAGKLTASVNTNGKWEWKWEHYLTCRQCLKDKQVQHIGVQA